MSNVAEVLTANMLALDELVAEAQRDPAPPAPQPRKRAPRKPTLARMLREAARAGVAVKAVEISGDRITLMLGEPEPTEDRNPWLRDLEGLKQ